MRYLSYITVVRLYEWVLSWVFEYLLVYADLPVDIDRLRQESLAHNSTCTLCLFIYTILCHGRSKQLSRKQSATALTHFSEDHLTCKTVRLLEKMDG